jgi:UDP-2,4-diacetamido-2,4,6-trideoxy-beta-L-altropyranose hydrolase
VHPEIRAVILTEAGPEMGFGHLGRCVALAEALTQAGARARLIVRGEPPVALAGAHAFAHAEWFDDGLRSELLAGADVAVVDSYQATLEVCESVAARAGAVLWFDDDLRLDYPPGIIVNGSPSAQLQDYPAAKHRALLLGPSYQCLRSAFWQPAERSVAPDASRALVVFGGTDVRGLGPMVADRVRQAYPDIVLDLVDSPRTAEKMRDSMRASDIAISAAGQTLYELACTGTPTIATCTAENQEPQAREFERAGAIVLAGGWSDVRVVDAIVDLVDALAPFQERARMARAGQGLVDGGGALRVAKTAIVHALDKRIDLRRARPEDEAPLLELANDAEVRSASFDTALITPTEHHEWFQARLADPDALLLMAWAGDTLAGYVRFQVAGESAEVSIALARGYRGRGLGELLLQRGITTLSAEHPPVRELVAQTRSGNAPSRRLFETAGFEQSARSASPADQVILVRLV